MRDSVFDVELYMRVCFDSGVWIEINGKGGKETGWSKVLELLNTDTKNVISWTISSSFTHLLNE
jgi:hypothetical protein